MGKKNEKKYMYIYESVKRDIITGVYKKGSKLPSKRTMAEDHDVSIITVEHAYELLIDEGYITSIEKSGYFVSFDEDSAFGYRDSLEEASHINRSHISVSESDVFLPEEESALISPLSFATYAKTARHVLSEYGDEIMEKASGSGTTRLRQAISEYLLRSRHMNAAYDQIIIGSGSEYLYGLIVQAFGRDLVYGIENPSYKKIEQVYTANGATIEKLQLGVDGIESKSLWNTDAKILHISPYKSYPSRVKASASKKREYLRWSTTKDGIIVEDDYESEFTKSSKPEETLFSMDEESRVVYVNTFTCTVGTSIRCAYMVIPRSLKQPFREKIGFYSCPVPVFDQYILADLINNGDFERHINRVRRKTRNLR